MLPIREHRGGFYDVVEVEIGKPKDGLDVRECLPRLGLYIARPYEAPLGIDTQALMRDDIHGWVLRETVAYPVRCYDTPYAAGRCGDCST